METNQNTTRLHVSDLISGMRGGFQVLDYFIFITMLALSAAIGIYFGYRDIQKNRATTTRRRRRDSIELDYLVGGRKLKIFPVAMSLTASWVSGISIMGMSTEIYVFGTKFVFLTIAILIGSLTVHYVFIPVFHDLKITSSFEYLEARFDKRLRFLSALIFVISMMAWLPIVFYVTALAFNQVTGINIHVITPITCFICIFYTCLGGIKAVVWTDVIQTVIMFGTMIFIVVKGTMVLGFAEIWHRNWESGRIEIPDLTIDPTVRHSITALIVGGIFYWTPTVSYNPVFMQRYVSLPTVRAARIALWIFVVSLIIMIGMCFYCGLLVYAWYHECDPITTKLAKSRDQILPVLVSDLFQRSPGLTGLFVSGIFSAALSSLSTALNGLSAIVLEDFVKQILTNRPSQRLTNFIMRGVVILCGLICVALVFVVEKLGSILQLSITIIGCTSGPMFAIFVMGLTMPRINTKSALMGGVFSVIVMICITVQSQLDQVAGRNIYQTKPISVENCLYDFEVSPTPVPLNVTGNESFSIIPAIHRISYMYYTLLGMSITMVIAIITSWFVKRDESEIRPELLAPFMRRSSQKCDYHDLVNKNVEIRQHLDRLTTEESEISAKQLTIDNNNFCYKNKNSG